MQSKYVLTMSKNSEIEKKGPGFSICIRFRQKQIIRGSHWLGSPDMSTISEHCEFYKQNIFQMDLICRKVQKWMVEQELLSRSSVGVVCSLLCSAELVFVDEWFVPLDYGKNQVLLTSQRHGYPVAVAGTGTQWFLVMVTCKISPRCRQ